ncbi:cupin domain-containing protein [Lactobacillus mulieris]|jgi:cupin family protein|uniref:Cupin domain-containing protein n=1 Tax=Lactobacillus mulieris TaxID=2508708 RepID=A0AAP3M4B1_9LACO|nr:MULTISPECIES: cupin domain-containing protein [Lactobacillus]EEU20901.1 hypothetical protein HMPREF0525_00937 [Lactobacillus jensenii 27-2-CHN]EEX23564.1 cupin family protein [Lactobacillus jensenii 115-3-CHN]EFH30251.1 cupin family protein [Lactobacillus jensenii JV-V16]KAA9243942.1 cupin domain-containing protein [Lactobacillus jensenii]KAA9368709.1 cupin domain-containing protein [Lactobacillus jensenii]
MDAKEYIEKLNLTPHPEGGYFKEVYQAKGEYELAEGKRKYFTSIYFLLTPETKSHLHRLNHDEVWYYHDGASLKIHCLYPDGHYQLVKLGKDLANGEQLSFDVPAGVIFGSELAAGEFALVSCMVAPGFDYQDFELFSQAELIKLYPEQKQMIIDMAYKK